MTYLTPIFAALCVLCLLPMNLAWTFEWRNASNVLTVENGTDAQRCTKIEQARNKNYTFDAQDDLVRIYLYGSSNCTGNIIQTSENTLANNSTVPLYAFAVIDLKGANTSDESEVTPFPGADWFKSSPNSPVITAMGKRLVEEDCGKYKEGPGPQWSEADRQSYQCWQEKKGYSGTSADGWPGKQTWDQLKVPLTVVGDSGSSSTSISTPSSTSTSTNTPTVTSAANKDTGSKPSLSKGEIGGIAVGSVIGAGLIGAIIYLSRRIGRRSASISEDAASKSQVQPKSGDVGVQAGAHAEEPDKPSVEHLPAEADTVSAKQENRHFAELSGDMVAAELSDSRKVLEMGDGHKEASR